jgi:glutamine amidotransferase-like uncharacterized protein
MVLIAASLIIVSVLPVPVLSEQSHSNERVIRVALYDCWGINNRYLQSILDYTWTNDKSYRFDVTVIDRDDVIGTGDQPLKKDRFDALIIGASAESYLVDGLNATWREKIRRFIADGGGYLGICGGANAASLGFEHPRNLFQRRVNQGVLGIADVYIRDSFLGEWQYLLKFGFDAYGWDHDGVSTPSYISVNTSVAKHPENVIFSGYEKTFRYITYAGGPGMYSANASDDLLGIVTPLLTYAEEPMNTKPIHYWMPGVGGWKIAANVTTDILDTFAAIATIFNQSGRVVLYGPHPENRVVVDGYIHEYRGHSMASFFLPIETFVFNYFGTPLDDTYNWWIVRRSVAWAAQIPDTDLPPIEA